MDGKVMSRMPNLLITGASGFTGQHACNHFVNAGFAVTAVSRKSFGNGQVQTELCDLTNKESVGKLIKKVKPDYLLHLAGQNHVGTSWIDPVSSLEANAMSTLYLLEALRQENPDCKVVIVGSALQFDPQNISTLTHPYSLSKTLQVLIAQSWGVLYNMNIVIAKPSNLIGPGISNGVCSIFAKKIVDMEENNAEKVLEVNNLQAIRDFVDVRDAVRAYEILLTQGKPGEIYDIASGNSHTLGEVITSFRDLTTIDFGIKSKVKDQEEGRGEISPVEIVKLGWKPVFSLKSSLEDILYFYRNNK
ncbi:NAD-dependent epimerase/dehydratase family protein [Peribacillus frigoritolerans]|uniref:NAD-dependent epimerase/dehydratase family protein n=1 Tax=Peribacillus frigoritolerans TaxID=450367 RepID=UPI001F26A448|nr:NAD-dependent epimerase/dehydratase family protein [Peribacillus frigoritolerans]MED3708572.1 NAD-dependent epimerase/dehydratase family protein [Peribacillus frigoritolerans]